MGLSLLDARGTGPKHHQKVWSDAKLGQPSACEKREFSTADGADSSLQRKGQEDPYLNCLACHSGFVFGKPTAGMGTNRFDFQTFLEDVRRTKGELFREHILGRPVNLSTGTFDAFSAAALLVHLRSDDFKPRSSKEITRELLRGSLIDNRLSLSASAYEGVKPAFVKPISWTTQTRYSQTSYSDATSDRDVRLWMQFSIVPTISVEEFHSLVPSFERLSHLIQRCRPAVSYRERFRTVP